VHLSLRRTMVQARIFLVSDVLTEQVDLVSGVTSSSRRRVDVHITVVPAHVIGIDIFQSEALTLSEQFQVISEARWTLSASFL